MVNARTIEKHTHVQDIARNTINHLKSFIQAGCTETDIAHEAETCLKKNGVDGFWYYNIGALVLVGERTPLSISGRIYSGPTQTAVKKDDIVTIDLAPMVNGYWGDFARTFVVSAGKVIAVDSSELEGSHVDEEWFEGMQAEERLHAKLKQTVRSGMTFDEIFHAMNVEIASLGFENLDFQNNLGHTIVQGKIDRSFIQTGSRVTVEQAGLFTFEPHIKKKESGIFGFKREDIYYLLGEKITVL